MRLKQHLFTLIVLACIAQVQAQCPDFTSSQTDPLIPGTICSGESITMSAEGTDLPIGGSVDWFVGTSPTFNAYAGEGSFIGTSPISAALSCANDVEVLYVMVNPDNGQVGSSGDRCDEFAVLWTGSGGFVPNDIMISNLGIGDTWTNFVPGTASTFNNCAVIPLGPADPVPPNAILIIQSHPINNVIIDALTLCATGLPVYVIANDSSAPCIGGYLDNTDPCGNCPYVIDITGTDCTYNLNLDYVAPSSTTNGWGFSNLTGGGVYADVIPDISVPAYLPEDPAIDDFTWTVPEDFCSSPGPGTYYINGIVNPAPTLPCTEVFTNYFEFQVSCPTAVLSGGGDICAGTCPDNPGQVSFSFSGGTPPYVAGVTVTIGGFPDISIPGQLYDAADQLNICVEGLIPFYDPFTETIILPETLTGSSVTVALTGMFFDQNNCQGDLSGSNSITINVISGPTASASTTLQSCEGAAVVLDGSVMGNGIGSWSSAGDGMFDDSSDPTTLYTPGPLDIIAGSVVLEWLVVDPAGICASDMASTTIEIFNSPTVDLDTEQTICSGESAELFATSITMGYQVSWTTSGDGMFVNEGALITSYIPGIIDQSIGEANLTITLTDPNGNCPDVIASQTVFIQTAIGVILPDTIEVCAGDPVELDPTITGNFLSVLWGTVGDGTFDDPMSPVTMFNPGPNDISDGIIDIGILVSDQSSVCPDTLGVVTIVIDDCQCPSVELSSPQTAFCNSDPSILSLGQLTVTPEPGSWTITDFPVGSSPASIANDEFIMTAADPGLYELTFTLNQPEAGCPESNTVIIEVIAQPQIVITNDDLYCDPSAIELIPLVEGSAEIFLWQTNGTGVLSTTDQLTTNYDFTAVDSIAGQVQFIVITQDSMALCPQATDTLNTTLVAPPFAEFSTTSENICNQSAQGSILNLSALIVSGDQGGAWSVVTGPAINLSNPESVDFDGITPGLITLMYRTNSAQPPCAEVDYFVTVQVVDCGCPPFFFSGQFNDFCATDTLLMLDNYVTGSGPGDWEINMISGSGAMPILFESNLTFDLSSFGTFELTYTLAAAPIAGCPDSVVAQFAVREGAAFSLPADTLVCEDTPVDLSVSDLPAGYQGMWSKNGDGQITMQSGLFTQYQIGPLDAASGNAVVYFTAVDDQMICPPIQDSILLNISNSAFATFSETQTAICNMVDSGSVVSLSGFIIGGDQTGSWMDVNGAGVDLSNPDNVDFNLVTPGLYTFTYTTASATLPCQNQPYDFVVVVEDCACPSVVTDLSVLIDCNRDFVNLNDYVQSPLDGYWTVISSPTGAAPATVVNDSIWEVSAADTGSYILRWTLIDSIPGCPASSLSEFYLDGPPLRSVVDVECVTGNLLYEVVVTTDGAIPIPSVGNIMQISTDTFLIGEIPIGSILQIEFPNERNGCTVFSDVLPPNCDCTLDFDFYTNDISCFGAHDGRIVLDSLVRSAAQPCIRLNGSSCDSIVEVPTIFDNLEPGVYTITVEDEDGCFVEKTTTIFEPEEIFVDLGPDLVINSGDSVLVDPMTNFTPLDWTYSPEFLDTSFYSGYFRLLTDLFLEISVSDSSDCIVTDQLLITVMEDSSSRVVLFVPNVFTPNGDQQNDVFFVQASQEIEQIARMQIFDRWGHLVFEQSNFPPNRPEFGWRGLTSQGDQLAPGVFAYVVQYMRKGQVRYLNGDITLLR